ncbi:MAG: type I-E CRISPR-associated protein Cse2/CasB [Lentisphaerota bacterium]
MDKGELYGKINDLMKFLYSNKEDRGVMADLRRGLSETTQNRAWPHISQFCDLCNKRERTIVQLIAAGFAIHGSSSSENANLGSVMRKIASGDGRGEDGLKTFESRFRRLLSASSSEELCDFLPGIIRTAETKGVSINFYKLYKDLIDWDWDDNVKINWAASFWTKDGGVE